MGRYTVKYIPEFWQCGSWRALRQKRVVSPEAHWDLVHSLPKPVRSAAQTIAEAKAADEVAAERERLVAA
jgi:hypothetical protein